MSTRRPPEPEPEPEPDYATMALDALIDLFAGADADSVYQFHGDVLVRIAERVREPVDEAPIRKSERERLARLFEENGDTLRNFAPDGLSIELLAFLLRLDHG